MSERFGFGSAQEEATWYKEDRDRLRGLIAELVTVIDALVEETADYMTINNLGDPEQQHNVKLARAVIKKVTGA